MKVLSTLDLQQNRVVNVGSAVDGSDLVTKAQLDAAIEAVKVKASCRTVATTNITLSGEQTIGATSVVAGDRVLVIGQTDAKTNGIYVASATAWARSADANVWSELVNAQVFVNVDRAIYRSDISNTGALGTDNVVFVEFLKYSELPANLAKKEVFTITGNGTSTIFPVTPTIIADPITDRYTAQVFDAGYNLVAVDINNDENNIKINFASAPANGAEYTVVVIS